MFSAAHPCRCQNAIITAVAFGAMAFLTHDIAAAGNNRDKEDPMDAHRQRAMTANRETRLYALLYHEELAKLVLQWDRTKPSSGHLRDYLAMHDPRFKELRTRWETPYSDDKLLSVLVFMAHQSALMRTFGGLLSEQEVINLFRDHKREIEELRAMLEEDRSKGLRSIAREKTDPVALDGCGISEERLASYREKIGPLKVSLVVAAPNPQLYCGGHYLVWLPTPPEPKPGGLVRVVENFDAEVNRQLLANAAYEDKHHRKPNKHSRIYRHIDENWYLTNDREGAESGSTNQSSL